MSELLEKLAELEHKQWMAWSQHLAKTENLKEPRLKRWQSLWVPYSELSEEEKEHDRNWAKQVLQIVESQQTKGDKLE